MASAEAITVEVAYACPGRQTIIKVSILKDASLKEAIQASGILEQFPEITLDKNKVGIFGKLTRQDHLLRPGDRIEIYRPLSIDPKQVRRERATKSRAVS